MKKKVYLRPRIEKIILDNTISLQMESPPPGEIDPTHRTGDDNSSPASSPFASPFGDKPFN